MFKNSIRKIAWSILKKEWSAFVSHIVKFFYSIDSKVLVVVVLVNWNSIRNTNSKIVTGLTRVCSTKFIQNPHVQSHTPQELNNKQIPKL